MTKRRKTKRAKKRRSRRLRRTLHRRRTLIRPGDRVRFNLRHYLGRDKYESGIVHSIDPNGTVHIDTPEGVMSFPREQRSYVTKK